MFFCHQMAPFDCHGSLWKSWKIMWRQAHRSVSLGGRGNVYILQFYTGNYFLICSGRACHSFLINQIENYCVTRDNKSTFNNYSMLVLANEALKMSCQKVVVIGVRNLVISAAWLSVQWGWPGHQKPNHRACQSPAGQFREDKTGKSFVMTKMNWHFCSSVNLHFHSWVPPRLVTVVTGPVPGREGGETRAATREFSCKT